MLKPASVDEIVQHSVGRALDLFEIDGGGVRRWANTSARIRPREPTRAKIEQWSHLPPPSSGRQILSRISPELDNDLCALRPLILWPRRRLVGLSRCLQEKLGVDVNILLFAIFARLERGVTLDTQDLAAIDGLVRGWRTEIVQVLRQVRRDLNPSFLLLILRHGGLAQPHQGGRAQGRADRAGHVGGLAGSATASAG